MGEGVLKKYRFANNLLFEGPFRYSQWMSTRILKHMEGLTVIGI